MTKIILYPFSLNLEKIKTAGLLENKRWEKTYFCTSYIAQRFKFYIRGKIIKSLVRILQIVDIFPLGTFFK